jgi:hypothetical protein
MTSTPVFVDGPFKRKKYAVEGHQFIVRVVKSPNLTDFPLDPTLPFPNYDEYVYYIHRLKFGDRTFVVASVNPIGPDMNDVIKVMFTNYAKQSEVA